MARRGEPVRFGLPFGSGVLFGVPDLVVHQPFGTLAPTDVRVMERWADGSVRWALVDARVDFDPSAGNTYRLASGVANPLHSQAMRVSREKQSLSIDTGVSRFRLGLTGHPFALDQTTAGSSARTILKCTLSTGLELSNRVSDVTVEEGALRTDVSINGTFDGHPYLKTAVRCTLFAGLPVVGLEIAITNTRRAEHPGGYWELGDTGSILLRELSLLTSFDKAIQEAGVSINVSQAVAAADVPFEIYQESSGGENWALPTHCARDGRVPMQFQGYRQTGSDSLAPGGRRATPVVTLRTRGDVSAAAVVPRFWQEFPKQIQVADDHVVIGLLPAVFPSAHELQGGERKTHRCFLAVGNDPVTSVPLDWCRDPIFLSATPEHYARAGAVPYLRPATADIDGRYNTLVHAAVEGDSSFFSKRETADEYGWRHFGDLYADHEAIHQPPGRPLSSHYNNQYDGIAGFLIHFMRFGDPRWWQLCDDLARHVADIDLYHTEADKSAYNGGLFWHTYHYVDADLSTHRCYARQTAPTGGGPSNEHNYTSGLMLHYLMTGHTPSRDAVIQLADWVLAMDDGRLTPFRWLTGGPTGLATATVSEDYHGPGRGAGNSINALLDAHRLSSDNRYIDKAEALIRRCVHPSDDVQRRELLDVEKRWSYTVFLQALGRYLDYKSTMGAVDRMYAYAQASLVTYASWMAAHEYPYLDKPERLQYPTETWAAQDMRKSDVFRLAARHLPSGRERFLERSRYFRERALATLIEASTRTLTRPLVLLLTNGYQHSSIEQEEGAAAPHAEWDGQIRPTRFVPQKQVARKRLVGLALLVALLILAGSLRLL